MTSLSSTILLLSSTFLELQLTWPSEDATEKPSMSVNFPYRFSFGAPDPSGVQLHYVNIELETYSNRMAIEEGPSILKKKREDDNNKSA